MYQTKDDLMREALVMGEFMRHMGDNWPGSDTLAQKIDDGDGKMVCPDFRIRNHGKVIAYAEVKYRTEPLETLKQHGGAFMRRDKYDMLKMLHDEGFRSFFVVGTPTQYAFWDVGKANASIGYGGRLDRNDPNDVGEMISMKHDHHCKVFWEAE